MHGRALDLVLSSSSITLKKVSPNALAQSEKVTELCYHLK